MFDKYTYVVLLTMLIGSTCVEPIGTKDIELQTCINNFDIHKDKIIRTQDSRAMGAKYLNEIDLDSREECLRLCCETDNCDVFVYEEKNAGSCYLFQCGPPEDFKCKFTHHVNYTSAVLAVNRHLPDLESQIKLTKHEQDLTKLRSPQEAQHPAEVPPHTTQSTTTTTTTTVKDIINKITKTPNNRKCSIYQFECRSTGECIAIYNACDGIPQCADGSDEAPELRCPDSITTTIAIPNRPVSANAPVPLENQVARYPSQSRENIYHPPVPPQHLNPKIPQDADFIRPNSPKYDAVPQMQQYQNWMPHQQQQFTDKNSHIFNHKENGLQVSEQGEVRYNKYKGAMQTLHRALGYSNPATAGGMQYGDYPKFSNYYGSEVYGRRPIPQMQENWPNNPQDFRLPNENSFQDVNPDEREHENWPGNIPAQIESAKPSPEKTLPPKDLPVNWKVEKETPRHEQDKMAHDLKNSREHFAVKTEEKQPTEEVKIKQVPHANGKYAVVAEYKIAETIEAIEDGVAETPGGAVLSLTLGLIITSLMGVLIGCRLRVVRRRLRRGGKSYAHDADYLVNGMYL